VRLIAGLVGVLLLAAGCSDSGSRPASGTITWTRVELAAQGRVLVRAAFECGQDLVVLGATADAAGGTSPAAWRVSGTEARPLTLDPGRDPYAAEAILTAGACRPDGRMSLFGSKAGGAHGMPRSSMWRGRADGSMVATRNPFEVFGGPNVGSYGTMAADARGWVMVGTRTTGGAVWSSQDGGHYRLREGVFGAGSFVRDVRRDDAGWVAAGFVVEDGAPRPEAWTSPDARRWTPHGLAVQGDGLSEAGRLAPLEGSDLSLAGFDSGRLALWDEAGGAWSREAALPKALSSLAAGGGQPAYVTGAAAGHPGLAVTFSDGTTFRGVNRTPSGTWLRLPLPERVPVSGDALVAVIPYGGSIALLVDDGRSGRLYLERPAA
jgi:hypothetical protein